MIISNVNLIYINFKKYYNTIGDFSKEKMYIMHKNIRKNLNKYIIYLINWLKNIKNKLKNVFGA